MHNQLQLFLGTGTLRIDNQKLRFTVRAFHPTESFHAALTASKITLPSLMPYPITVTITTEHNIPFWRYFKFPLGTPEGFVVETTIPRNPPDVWYNFNGAQDQWVRDGDANTDTISFRMMWGNPYDHLRLESFIKSVFLQTTHIEADLCIDWHDTFTTPVLLAAGHDLPEPWYRTWLRQVFYNILNNKKKRAAQHPLLHQQ